MKQRARLLISKDAPERIRKRWKELTPGQRWYWTRSIEERRAYREAKRSEVELDMLLRSIDAN